MTVATVQKLAKPLIFTGESIRGILRGSKTQTRRVLKHQPHFSEGRKCWMLPCGRTHCWMNQERTEVTNRETGATATTEREVPLPEFLMKHCPYSVGDHLYVKEAWCPRSGGMLAMDSICRPRYRATEELRPEWGFKWRSPLFMPRWASRIELEIVGLTVERVQYISEEDAIAEGFDKTGCAAALKIAAKGVEPGEAYNVEDEDGDKHDGWLCIDCAKKIKKGDDYLGWGCTPEDDGPAFCDKCGIPLLISLSKYGIERELRIEDDPDGKEPRYYPCTASDAAIARMIAHGIGDLCDEHMGRLAQIGFATAWNNINGKPGRDWESNPYVWCIAFKRAEGE